MGQTVDLRNISRFFFAADLPFFATGVGTENCGARFRLTSAQERIVRKHFNIRADRPIKFTTSEIASQGNGWYLAFSLFDKIDQALKAILNIKAALWHANNQNLSREFEREQALRDLAQKIVAKVSPKRLVIVKQVTDSCGRVISIACDRTRQALTIDSGYGLKAYRTEKIRSIMCQTDLNMAVANLQDHFKQLVRCGDELRRAVA